MMPLLFDFAIQAAENTNDRALLVLGADATTPEEAADRAFGVLATAAAIEAAIKPMKEAARALLGEVVAEVGTVQTATGSAKQIAGYVRAGWDAKGLEKLASQSPTAAELLAPYRTETTVGPSVKVELTKGKSK